MSALALNKFVCHIGKSAVRMATTTPKSFFSVSSRFNVEKKYTDKHEWISMDGNVGTIGITDYAQDKLGEVVYAELPEVSEELEQTVQFATLESVKAVSECYTPVAGRVVAVNEAVQENPSLINKNPMDDGWLIKLDLTNKDQLEKLMDQKQYDEYLKSEDH